MKVGELLTAQGVIYAVISAACFDYSLFAISGKDVPWYADVIVGFFFGWIAAPAAIICWIIKLCGVVTPLIH